MGEYY